MCLNAVCCIEMLFSVKLKSLPPKSTCENPAEPLGCMFCFVCIISVPVLFWTHHCLSFLIFHFLHTLPLWFPPIMCSIPASVSLLWTYKLWVLLVLSDNPWMYSAFNSVVFPVAWLTFCWISYLCTKPWFTTIDIRYLDIWFWTYGFWTLSVSAP